MRQFYMKNVLNGNYPVPGDNVLFKEESGFGKTMKPSPPDAYALRNTYPLNAA